MRSYRRSAVLGVLPVALFSLALSARPACARVVYVNRAASGTVHDGASWATAFTMIQESMNVTQPGDEVWVAQGVYSESVGVPNAFALYGGFRGDETSRDARDWSRNRTILEGDSVGFGLGASADGAVIDGFTIRVHWPTTPAINIQGSSPTIAHNTITAGGIGVQYAGGAPVITENVFTGCGAWSVYGQGGVGGQVLRNRMISCNSGVYLSGGSGTVAGNLILGGGQALSLANAAAITVNNTIAGCDVWPANGASLISVANSTGTFANNIVAFNAAGIKTDAATGTTFRNNCIYGNRFYDVQGITGLIGTNGNISADPLLADLAHADAHIQPTSPCRNAGDSASVPASLTVDLDGQARILDGTVDIGADESDGTLWSGTPRVVRVIPTGSDGADGASWATAKRTIQAAIGDLAGSGGEVWVAAGTYREHVSIPAGVWVYGGFAGSEATRDARDFHANPTILGGDGSTFPNVSIMGGYHLAALDGFVVRDAAAGAISTSTSPIIARNTITANATQPAGSVISIGSSTVLADNLIVNNHGSWSILDVGDGAMLVNNTVADNVVDKSSGVSGNVLIVRTPIDATMPPISLVNNIVAFNSAGINGQYTTPTMSHNIVWNATEYERMVDPTGFNGNLHTDPLFVDHANGDYHLLAPSPGMDRGDPAALFTGAQDAYAQPRVQGRRIDIGALESPYSLPPDLPLVRVSPTGNDANDGSDWAHAKKTVASALGRVASPGGEVWVAAGTYVENLVLPAGVSLFGGFAGTETDRAARDPKANVTVLDGGNAGPVILDPGGSGPEVSIDGFTIRNGHGRVVILYQYSAGGGIYCDNASPNIRNNIFAANNNGAIYCTNGAAPLIAGNAFTGNAGWGVLCEHGAAPVVDGNTFTGANGGGVSANASTIIIRNNTIEHTGAAIDITNNSTAQVEGNTVRHCTGGIYFNISSGSIVHNVVADTSNVGIAVWDCSPLVEGNTVLRNVSSNSGGGLLAMRSQSIIRNNIFWGNAAFNPTSMTPPTGGGLYCNGSERVYNNTIVANTAADGGAIGCGGSTGGTVAFVSNIVAFNSSGVYKDATSAQTINVYNSCLYANSAYNAKGIADPVGRVGNIGTDPLLADYRGGNLHIQPSSPCVDHGSDVAVADGETDIDGQPRIQGAAVDIGADESDGTVWPVAPTRVLRVSPNGDDANDGSDWARAKKTPQGALDALNGFGGEVWVAAGTYNQLVALGNLQSLLGGFAGTETDRAQRNPVANPTILDGQSAGTTVTIGVGATGVLLDGFTVRNSNGSTGSAPGGIIVSGMSQAEVSHNVITGNHGQMGGGIGVFYCDPQIHNNVISGNTATYGGAVGIEFGNPVIRDNLMTGNISFNGSAIYLDKKFSPLIANNTIVGNTSQSQRGAIYCVTGGTQMVVNNIVAFNTGGGLVVPNLATYPMHNNVVYGNTLFNFQGFSSAAVAANIQADPLFMNAAAGDYHLTPLSPAVDAGDDTVLTANETDLDGAPRKQGAHVDAGAYELSRGSALTVTDVARALRLAAGLGISGSADMDRLNVDTTGDSATLIDIPDALTLARKIGGLAANP